MTEEFNFEEFEKHIPVFTNLLKIQMQTRMFNPVAPNFDVEVTIIDRGRGYGKQINVTTSNIAEHMNFNMFESVRIINFGGDVIQSEPNMYWLPIDWRWESKGGGSNGTRAFTLHINDKGEILKVREEV